MAGEVTLAVVLQNLAQTQAGLTVLKSEVASFGNAAGAAGGGGDGPSSPGVGGLSGWLGRMSHSATSGEGSIRRLSTAVAFMAAESVGARGPLVRVAEGLLLFGGGH